VLLIKSHGCCPGLGAAKALSHVRRGKGKRLSRRGKKMIDLNGEAGKEGGLIVFCFKNFKIVLKS